MKVVILFKDQSLMRVNNVKKVTNAAANNEDDWIYIYKDYDIPDKPSIGYPMKKIIRVEVSE